MLNRNSDDERSPVPQRAVLAIQDAIRRKVYQPGMRLPAQRILAEELKVSRASLREALSTLEALGFVRTEAGRGTFVTPDGSEDSDAIGNWRFLGRYDIEEVYDFRYLTEPVAVRLAAVQMTDDEISHLHDLHERYKSTTLTLDLVASTDIDYEFHHFIMKCSRNRLFVEVYDQFRQVFRETQMLPFSRHQRLWEPRMEHGKILEALTRRDPDGAAYYMSMHIARATDRIGVKLTSLV